MLRLWSCRDVYLCNTVSGCYYLIPTGDVHMNKDLAGMVRGYRDLLCGLSWNAERCATHTHIHTHIMGPLPAELERERGKEGGLTHRQYACDGVTGVTCSSLVSGSHNELVPITVWDVHSENVCIAVVHCFRLDSPYFSFILLVQSGDVDGVGEVDPWMGERGSPGQLQLEGSQHRQGQVPWSTGPVWAEGETSTQHTL